MAAARPVLGLLAMILLAGGIVLQILVILSGLKGSPVNQIYFLQADTSSIKSTSLYYHNPARWTYLDICGVSPSGKNMDCSKKSADIPFDPVKNFGTTKGVPSEFVKNPHRYFYLSRVAWAFYLIALAFAALALLASLAALFARLGAYMSGLTTFLAMICQAVAAALMTSWTIMARKAFHNAGATATLGIKAYGFTWGAVGAFLLASILFCIGGSVGKSKSSKQQSSYFGRKRSTRNRGSFVENENGHRVKEEYE